MDKNYLKQKILPRLLVAGLTIGGIGSIVNKSGVCEEIINASQHTSKNNITEEFLKELEEYGKVCYKGWVVYGISRDTEDYFLNVMHECKIVGRGSDYEPIVGEMDRNKPLVLEFSRGRDYGRVEEKLKDLDLDGYPDIYNPKKYFKDYKGQQTIYTSKEIEVEIKDLPPFIQEQLQKRYEKGLESLIEQMRKVREHFYLEQLLETSQESKKTNE